MVLVDRIIVMAIGYPSRSTNDELQPVVLILKLVKRNRGSVNIATTLRGMEIGIINIYSI